MCDLAENCDSSAATGEDTHQNLLSNSYSTDSFVQRIVSSRKPNPARSWTRLRVTSSGIWQGFPR